MAVITKSQQVERYLRSSILRGRWNAGEALPSERELLPKMGVSRTTLRDALNALANDGLIVRRHGLGTYVSEIVKTSCVAILANAEDLSSPVGYWFRNLVEESQKCISGSGYRPVLSTGYGDSAEQFISSTRLFDRPNLKDTLGVLNTISMGAVEDRLTEAGVPYITIGSGVGVGGYRVVPDYEQLTKLAVEMLRARGYDDFAVMYHSAVQNPNDEYDRQLCKDYSRIAGSAVGFDERRLILVGSSPTLEDAYQAFKEWWNRPGRPNAIFFYDDGICDVATRAILEMGIRVPDELAIVTMANAGRQFHFPVPLTRVGFDPAQVAMAAWNMLDKLIAGELVEEPTFYIAPKAWHGESL